MRLTTMPAAALVLVLLVAPLHARETASVQVMTVPASGVIGMQEAYLSPDFWIARLRQPDRVVLDGAAIAAQNARMMRTDDSMHDLRALPPTLGRDQVAEWISDLSSLPDKPVFDVDGQPVSKRALDAVVANLALDAIAPRQPTRYGLVLRRAPLRAFPTSLRVFGVKGDTDIDRFQESALFPGTPVAVAHQSRDGGWLFVVSPDYAAWVETRHVAEGAKDAVLAYTGKAPYRIVTGAKVETVFTPEQSQLSELQLDMGTRVPLASVPADVPVNGQHSYTSHVLELPIRGSDGKLQFAPALLQKNTDTAGDYLPLTRANIIRQGFKFLGERYGWGHDYDGRDCSGFVSEVYRSMGVTMPRNTGDQAASPALDRIQFRAGDGRAKRMAAVAALHAGDLIYIPGHVMLVIGRIDGIPYVIHDINGGSYLDADGRLHSMHLNAVSVTPLTPLRFSATRDYIDSITNIVRITSP